MYIQTQPSRTGLQVNGGTAGHKHRRKFKDSMNDAYDPRQHDNGGFFDNNEFKEEICWYERRHNDMSAGDTTVLNLNAQRVSQECMMRQ